MLFKLVSTVLIPSIVYVETMLRNVITFHEFGLSQHKIIIIRSFISLISLKRRFAVVYLSCS